MLFGEKIPQKPLWGAFGESALQGTSCQNSGLSRSRQVVATEVGQT